MKDGSYPNVRPVWAHVDARARATVAEAVPEPRMWDVPLEETNEARLQLQAQEGFSVKLIEGQRYNSKYGVLTYRGFSPPTGFYCDGCDRLRGVHEFLLGDYPQHTQVYHYGTECVKKFLKEAEVRQAAR